jgi:hypothetical protein
MSNQVGSEIIRFKCSECSADLIAPRAHVGEIIICSGCKASVTVPAQGEPAQFEAVVAAPKVSTPAVAARDIPVSDDRPAAVVEGAAVRTLSMGSSEAADPTSRSNSDYTARSSGAGTAYPARRVKPAPKSSRGAIVGLALAIVIVAGGGVGYSMHQNKQRLAMQDQIGNVISKADTATGEGDIDAIDRNAKEAESLLKQHGKGLDQALTSKWNDRLKFYAEVRRNLSELQEMYDKSEASFVAAKTPDESEKILTTLRSKLEAKRSAEGPVKESNKPVIAKLESLTRNTAKLQEKQKVRRIRDDLQTAQKLYTDGKIEDAGVKARKISEDLGAAPPVQDQKIEAGVKQLLDRFAVFKTAEEIRLKPARFGYTESLRKLQAEIDKLGEDIELKPLRAKLLEFKNEVSEDEKTKLDNLKKSVAAAEAQYQSGKIEEAGDSATKLSAELKPLQADKELESRLAELQKIATEFKQAKDIRSTASADYAGAREKLEKKLNEIDPNNAQLRPLAAAIRILKREVHTEQHPQQKLSAKELDELRQVALALTRDKNIELEGAENDSVGVKYDGKSVRLTIGKTAISRMLLLQSGDNRFMVKPEDLLGRTGQAPHAARVLRHASELGEAMQKAGVWSEDIWDATAETPFPSARRTEAGKEVLFLNDRLYIGTAQQKSTAEKEAEADFVKKVEALANAVENDTASDEDSRRVIVFAIRAAAKEAEWFDHLKGEFVRRVLAGDYIESNLPGTATRLKKELADYREAFAKISNTIPFFTGASAKGDELVEGRTYEEHSVWQIYDKAADTTTFAIKDPDDEKGGLFILYDFAGKQTSFPGIENAKKVRMSHQAAGVIATYDPASGKMTHDQDYWDKAVALEAPPYRTEVIASRGFGPPAWSLPPHVLLVDQHATTKGIVTPYGKLEVKDFSKIADVAKRNAEKDQFLAQMAKVLPTANYLHLYFRYFHEYILDSPITSNPTLLGSRTHCGDLHQTAHESLNRLMGGRYVGDCDDLAELFMQVTRMQNKLSFVMSLPAHAACGWTEKGDDGMYTFYIVDTGPPRVFKHKELDKVIEMACRAYDDNNTMRFDPKSLGYLFRFNGEATRTPYWLSSRMYTDKPYAEAMELVQSYWHFHFYALGINTMLEMIEKGDRVPENCIELAGLYGQVRETEESIRWTAESMKQLGPEDRSSRFNETSRIASLWRVEKNYQKAYEVVQDMIAELKQLENERTSLNFHSTRLELMGVLQSIERPWEAWDVVRGDIQKFFERRALRIEHVGGLTSLYKKMKDLIAEGKVPDVREKAEMQKLENILMWFYANSLFEPDDDFNSYMRKYASLGIYYAGKYGNQRLKDELLKGAPFPDVAKPREHTKRKDPEEEDWKWIRLSIPSYSVAIADAIDFDEPETKWKKDDAVKLIDAMLKAGEEAKKFGSLSSAEYEILSKRVLRAFLIKDWADLDKVLAETGKRNFARLTTEISETFGQCAKLVTPEEFVQQYKVFAKYIKSRTSYFTVVYEAYRNDGYDQAVAASKVALDCWPGDKDMAREAKYLKELADKKKAKVAAEPKK